MVPMTLSTTSLCLGSINTSYIINSVQYGGSDWSRENSGKTLVLAVENPKIDPVKTEDVSGRILSLMSKCFGDFSFLSKQHSVGFPAIA